MHFIFRCGYLVSDWPMCRELLEAAITHSIDIALSSDHSLINLTQLPAYSRRIFDPFSRPLLNSIPVAQAKVKLAHCFCLLGNILLLQATQLEHIDPDQYHTSKDELEELYTSASQSFQLGDKIMEGSPLMVSQSVRTSIPSSLLYVHRDLLTITVIIFNLGQAFNTTKDCLF